MLSCALGFNIISDQLVANRPSSPSPQKGYAALRLIIFIVFFFSPCSVSATFCKHLMAAGLLRARCPGEAGFLPFCWIFVVCRPPHEGWGGGGRLSWAFESREELGRKTQQQPPCAEMMAGTERAHSSQNRLVPAGKWGVPRIRGMSRQSQGNQLGTAPRWKPGT